MEEIDKALGQTLKTLRTGKKWSQEKLALEAEANRNYVSLIELGRNSPSVGMLFRLCTALGVSPALVLQEVEQRVARAITSGTQK